MVNKDQEFDRVGGKAARDLITAARFTVRHGRRRLARGLTWRQALNLLSGNPQWTLWKGKFGTIKVVYHPPRR